MIGIDLSVKLSLDWLFSSLDIHQMEDDGPQGLFFLFCRRINLTNHQSPSVHINFFHKHLIFLNDGSSNQGLDTGRRGKRREEALVQDNQGAGDRSRPD